MGDILCPQAVHTYQPWWKNAQIKSIQKWHLYWFKQKCDLAIPRTQGSVPPGRSPLPEDLHEFRQTPPIDSRKRTRGSRDRRHFVWFLLLSDKHTPGCEQVEEVRPLNKSVMSRPGPFNWGWSELPSKLRWTHVFSAICGWICLKLLWNFDLGNGQKPP